MFAVPELELIPHVNPRKSIRVQIRGPQAHTLWLEKASFWVRGRVRRGWLQVGKAENLKDAWWHMPRDRKGHIKEDGAELKTHVCLS